MQGIEQRMKKDVWERKMAASLFAIEFKLIALLFATNLLDGSMQVPGLLHQFSLLGAILNHFSTSQQHPLLLSCLGLVWWKHN